MFHKKTSIVFICVVWMSCESAFVDQLTKCSSKDFECTKGVLQHVLRETAKTGIPEFSIPTYDPYVVEHESFTILDFLNISFFDGVAKGVKDCEVNKLEVNFEKMRAKLDLTCDIKIKGKYSAYGSSEAIKQLLGGQTVHGDGNAKVTIDKLKMKSIFRFAVVERGGDTFIKCKHNSSKISFDIGNMSFAASDLYLGDAEASTLITNVMNGNWKFLVDTVGKPFLDRATQIMLGETFKFFGVVPTKYYLADDLSPYVGTE